MQDFLRLVLLIIMILKEVFQESAAGWANPKQAERALAPDNYYYITLLYSK